MEYRYLGNSGLRLSVIGFGAWVTWGSQVDDEIAFQCMKKAFDHGCNFFDNAEVYASGKAEETMGRCIQRLGVPRSELVISTKIFWGGKGVNQRGLSRKHIIEGMKDSLKRLQLEYVDLIFCHRPDFHTPMEEVVRAMNWIIEQGWAFYWGTSEWSAAEIMEAHEIAKNLRLISPVMEQPQYNMLHRTRFEKEYLPLYEKMKLGTTIWSPLASGVLTGKYKGKDFEPDTRLGLNNQSKWLREDLLDGKGLNGLEEKDFGACLAKAEGLKPIAAKLGCTLAQLALAWCAKNPHVTTVITGASKVEQVEENFKVITIIPKLTPEILNEIEDVLKNKPTPVRDFR